MLADSCTIVYAAILRMHNKCGASSYYQQGILVPILSHNGFNEEFRNNQCIVLVCM